MASSRVIVDNRFGKLQAEMDRGIQRALGQAAQVTIATAVSAPTPYEIEAIQRKFVVGRPRVTRRGWELDIVWTDWRVWFFERGTYQKKGRLKRGGNPPGPNRGVKPARFLRKGVKAGRFALLAAIQRELR